MERLLAAKVPTEQASQDAAPGPELAVPGLHGEQVMDPFFLAKVPGSHGEQEVDPSSLEKEPAGHSRHCF